MTLESAQLLSNVMTVLGDVGPYRPTHIYHPCSKWARETRGNYEWLLRHFEALAKEYTFRYGKVHKSFGHFPILAAYADNVSNGKRLPFVNVTPFKGLPVHIAYQQYLVQKWENDNQPAWTNRRRPF